MRYSAVVLSVADINASRTFYEDLFDLEVYQNYGINICFTCGLALQQEFHWLIGVEKSCVMSRTNNVELCFEEENFDGFLSRLKEKPDIEYLGDVVQHSWGQRVVRFYDPDGHLIEVGENMGSVIRRFLHSGLTMEEISVKMDASVEDLEKLLQQ